MPNGFLSIRMKKNQLRNYKIVLNSLVYFLPTQDAVLHIDRIWAVRHRVTLAFLANLGEVDGFPY